MAELADPRPFSADHLHARPLSLSCSNTPAGCRLNATFRTLIMLWYTLSIFYRDSAALGAHRRAGSAAGNRLRPADDHRSGLCHRRPRELFHFALSAGDHRGQHPFFAPRPRFSSPDSASSCLAAWSSLSYYGKLAAAPRSLCPARRNCRRGSSAISLRFWRWLICPAC